MRINLLPNENNMFVLEGYTRPAMKQAKGISSGEGLYACSIIFDETSGKILAAKRPLVCCWKTRILQACCCFGIQTSRGHHVMQC